MADRVAVLGATATPARSPRRSSTATRASTWPHVTARAEAGQRLDDVHPRTRVPLTLEVFDPTSTPSTPPSSPTRTAPPRRSSPSCATRRAWSTSPPTSGCATAASTRTGTASTRRRSSSARASTGCRSCTATRLARRRPRRQPRLLPDRGAARARPLARAGLIADVVIDAKSGVSGAGRAPTHSTHFISPTRTSRRTRSRATATRPRSSRSSPRWAPTSRSRSRRTCCRSPGRAGVLLRHAVARAAPDELDELYDDAYAASRSWSCRTGRPACSTCATRTTAGSPAPRPADGPDHRLRGDRQPVEGRRVAGRAEPQPDVRARRARRLRCSSSRWLERARRT